MTGPAVGGKDEPPSPNRSFLRSEVDLIRIRWPFNTLVLAHWRYARKWFYDIDTMRANHILGPEPSMQQDLSAKLEERLGRVHARQRLGIEKDYEQRVFGHGINFLLDPLGYSQLIEADRVVLARVQKCRACTDPPQPYPAGEHSQPF